MTKQELFDKCLQAIREQGKPSLGELGNCRYRGKNGLKCAAGVFIPDARYRETMEQQLCTSVVFGDLWLTLDIDVFFLRKLQIIHDYNCRSSNFVEYFNQGMRQLARDEGLQYREVTP